MINLRAEKHPVPEVMSPIEVCSRIKVTASENDQPLLEFLEKHGFVWINGAQKPTQWHWTELSKPILILINDTKEIALGGIIGTDMPSISQEELLNRGFNPQQWSTDEST
jgi:hypothetical protein